MKVDDFDVWKSPSSMEMKFIMENDIPIQFRTLNTIEVDYGTFFDPPDTARFAEILVSTDAQI